MKKGQTYGYNEHLEQKYDVCMYMYMYMYNIVHEMYRFLPQKAMK